MYAGRGPLSFRLFQQLRQLGDIRRAIRRASGPDVGRAWPQLSSSFERKLRQFGDTGRDPLHLIFAN
jgi:hypothetical protein